MSLPPAAGAGAGHRLKHEGPAWRPRLAVRDSNAPRRGDSSSAPYPAAGAGHPRRREWRSGPAAPRRGDSSSASEGLPRSPMPTDSMASAGHPPLHESHPGEGSSSGEWRPRSPEPDDPFTLEYFHKMAGFYVEAATRLPLDKIPYLARCIRDRGLAVGFGDPVTNIILTTIDAFAHTHPGMMYTVDGDIEATTKKITFVDIARSSWGTLNTFLMCYFRHLTAAQSRSLVKAAGYDLRQAIEAVQQHLGDPGPQFLVPDSARVKTAFMEAIDPRSSAPDFVRLMTSSYCRSMVDSELEDLCQGGKITDRCVEKLCRLLCSPWSPPIPRLPPPTPGTFRDSNGDIIMIVCFGDGFFATTRFSQDGQATTTLTSSRQTQTPADFPDETTNLLTMFPLHYERLLNHEDFYSTTLESPEFLPFLKFQLIDIIHGVYLKAIAMLPVCALREGHLLYSLVTAGHCYGQLDPVANIVINTAWYNAHFPLSKEIASEVGAADILDARSMHRVEFRSIDGLVCYLCRSSSIDEQKAVSLLCKSRLDTPIIDLSNICDVTLAAKHPQSAAFAAFLECVPTRRLYEMYCQSRVVGNLDSAFEGLKMALLQETTRIAAAIRSADGMDRSDALERLNDTPRQEIALETLFTKRFAFASHQAHVRRVLEELLNGYGFSNPLVPPYKLGVICGVTRQRNYSCTNVYHANFLASSDGGLSWNLFFAEFWNQFDKRIGESKNPFCCPIPDYHQYPGRCVVCENSSSVIVHPQSRTYNMGNYPFCFPVPGHLGDCKSGKLDIDVLYSSPEKVEEEV